MIQQKQCEVCFRDFPLRFRYQARDSSEGMSFVCSQRCLQKTLACDSECSQCQKSFALAYPWQMQARGSDDQLLFCSHECRSDHANAQVDAIARTNKRRRIAVFNHKGGTGKTTTSVHLAAGLAEKGLKVLLIDADGQGNIAASLNLKPHRTLYHVLVHGTPLASATVRYRDAFDVLASNESLAAAELFLAKQTNRDRVLRNRIGKQADHYDVVIVDCAPALSLMNQNALCYVDGLIVPVACDYLSLVGVSQVVKTLKNVRKVLKHDIELVGVLPTHYDRRLNLAKEALAALHKHFGEKVFDPIRNSSKLKEAPAYAKTVFEHAPMSHGAIDYRRMVDRIEVEGLSRSFARPSLVTAEAVAHGANPSSQTQARSQW